MCQGWVSRLRRWDPEGILEFIPYQDPSVQGRFPWIPPAASTRAVQIVAPDGDTWEGAGAAEKLAQLLPGGRPLAALFRLPLARSLGDAVYRWVARRRRAGRCSLHGS